MSTNPSHAFGNLSGSVNVLCRFHITEKSARYSFPFYRKMLHGIPRFIPKTLFILTSPRYTMPCIEAKLIERVAQRRRHPIGMKRINPRPIAPLGPRRSRSRRDAIDRGLLGHDVAAPVACS